MNLITPATAAGAFQRQAMALPFTSAGTAATTTTKETS